MMVSNEGKCRKLAHEYTLCNNQKDYEIERLKQLVVKLNAKNAKLVEQLEEYTIHEHTQAIAGVQDMVQSHPTMFHGDPNVLDIMSLSASSLSDVNVMVDIRRVETHMTPTHQIGQVARNVDVRPLIKQIVRRTIMLQNLVVRNIKNKNGKEHKLQKYDYPLVLGRLKKPPEGGVVDVGECVDNEIMYEDIIDVDDLAEPKKTFSQFDLTNRLPIWKLLSKQEKDKLKEAYEKGRDISVQIWIGRNGLNYVRFNDIWVLIEVLIVQGNVIDSYTKMLMYEQQIMSVGSTNEENSYIFSTSCLPMIRDMSKDTHNRADCGIIICFIMMQLMRHLDMEKSMGGKSYKSVQAEMVNSFVNNPTRSFVDEN
ncbi:hypothetical protein CsSME_00018928 [Camellia sinensis var. sinensis]